MILVANRGMTRAVFEVNVGGQGASHEDLGSLVSYLTDCGWDLLFQSTENADAGFKGIEVKTPGEISDFLEPRDG